jgi:acetyl/propionyl-CoA carboxylase alpha subunit
MISKLCSYGFDRPTAIARMRRALGEYHVGGIKTNLAFHRRVMRHAVFASGDYDTGFIAKHKADLLTPAVPDDQATTDAAVTGALWAHGKESAEKAARATGAGDGPENISAWRRQMLFR